jgi:hypothetical protein
MSELPCTGEEDLRDVLDELKDVTALCYQIGTRLGLKACDLDLIRAHKFTYVEAMERIILYWLWRNYNVDKFGVPTWKALVEAVAHPGGGNHKGLADEIAQRHLGSISVWLEGMILN